MTHFNESKCASVPISTNIRHKLLSVGRKLYLMSNAQLEKLKLHSIKITLNMLRT